MRVDVHNHVIPQRALELFGKNADFGFIVEGETWTCPHHRGLPLWRSMYDPAEKIAELKRNGLDGAIVSVNPLLYYYEADLGLAEELWREMNRGMAEFCQHDAAALHWMAQVPLQSPERAAEVLELAAADGAVGAEIDTTVSGKQLDDYSLEPFWAAAENLGLPVFLHPSYAEEPAAIKQWYLHNAVGLPLLTTIAIERMICAGVLERHPGLRLVLAHAGGYFPWQAGRLAHARKVTQELAATPGDPWSYLGQLYFDTITHDREALRYLVTRVGVDHVLVGTDLPTHMALLEPVDRLTEAVGEGLARQIAEDNAARVFRLDARSGDPAVC